MMAVQRRGSNVDSYQIKHDVCATEECSGAGMASLAATDRTKFWEWWLGVVERGGLLSRAEAWNEGRKGERRP